MSDFSNYTSAAVLNHTLRGSAMAVPSGTYLALFTSDPTDTGAAGTECAGGWYARQSIGLSTGWTAPALVGGNGGNMSQNAAIIAFNPVTGASVTVTHVAIMDAPTGGNMLYHSALAASKTLQIGDVLQFAAGSIQATVD